MPAGYQPVISRRFFVAFEAKRGIGDNNPVEDFAQRHHRRDAGRQFTA